MKYAASRCARFITSKRWSMARILLLILASFGTFASPTRAQAGPVYFYVATTVDANGFESAFSNQVTATFNQGQHNAVLTWTAATVPTGGAAIAGYNMYRSKTTGGPYVKINTALITSGVTYTDTFVLPNAPILAAPTTN
jgi:hypothetical protein